MWALERLATELVAPDTAPVDELEPSLCADALRRFLAAHGSVDGLPMAVSMRAFYHVTVSGDREAGRAAARALVAQLVTLHSPADLTVAVAASPEAAGQWDWTKWLPHTQLSERGDGAGTARLFRSGLGELAELLGGALEGRPRFGGDDAPVLDRPHILVVLDGGTVPADSPFVAAEGLQGVTVVELVPGDLGEPRGGLSVVVQSGRLRRQPAAGPAYEGRPDGLPLPVAESLARQLAPLRPAGGEADEPLLAPLDFTDLLGLGDAAAVDVSGGRGPRTATERLRVPIGVGEDGQPVMLDLKEAAQEGMGPHGLCVGATGSGKSELLRTLVLALAVTHSSETLNFVLADFKGGATFTGLSSLPHVAAVITNLAGDLALVDRMGMRSAASCSAARNCCAPPATSPMSTATSGRGRPGSRSNRCRRWSLSSTSSPNSSPPSRISSTCSFRSDGSAARWRCICCSPRSVWRRDGYADSTPISPTGSVCGRSRRPSRAPRSGSRMPITCRRYRDPAISRSARVR